MKQDIFSQLRSGADVDMVTPEYAEAISEMGRCNQICFRINTISPGVIVTPLAYDEFNANGEGYQRMIDASAARRTGTSDEIAEAAAFLLGEHARFITGTDLLIDGGVIAAIRTGEYQLG